MREEDKNENLEGDELENETQDNNKESDVDEHEDDAPESDEERSSAEDLDEEYLDEEDPDKSQISQIQSLVGKDPKKSMMMLVVFVMLIGAGIYYFFYDKPTDKISIKDSSISLGKKQTASKATITTPKIRGSSAPAPDYSLAIDPNKFENSIKKVSKVDSTNNSKAQLDAKAQKVKVLTPKSPQPEYQDKPSLSNNVPSSPSLASLGNKSGDVSKNRSKAARLKSSMILTGGASNKSGKKSSASRGVSKFSPEHSSAKLSRLTKIGNMSNLITQGKIIETVLETPINTNYPGPIRSIISRDVYSEMGENVLIPKGSRVIGKIVGGYKAGHTRVIITWDRIILPTGYDIKIESAPGVGKLGLIGVEGIVDRQLWNTLGNTVLLSALNVGVAKLLDSEFGVGKNTQTSSVSSDGTQTSTKTTSPTQDAIINEINTISSTFKQWIASNFTSVPFITVDQGTVVKIFVNSDIQFPSDISSGVNVLK